VLADASSAAATRRDDGSAADAHEGAPESAPKGARGNTRDTTRDGKRRRRGRRGARSRRAGNAAVTPSPTPAAPVAPPPSATPVAGTIETADDRITALTAIAPSAAGSRRDRAELETSAGGIVYRMQDGEALFLLIRDSYRNWGFPKGHLEDGEQPQDAAVREVQEETGLGELRVDGAIETIDWFFRFRGKLVHKVCHFYLMRTRHARTSPQRDEGITACRWARFEDATRLISYANARAVLLRAHDMVIAEESRRG